MSSTNQDTPDTMEVADRATVTPVKRSDAMSVMVDTMAALLTVAGGNVSPFKTAVTTMLTDWQVTCWEDLSVFNDKDVMEYIADKSPMELSPLIISKRLGYLVRYAKLGKPLMTDLTMAAVIREVDDFASAGLVRAVRFQNSPSRASSVLTTDMKTVPDLEKFTGKDEDYYSWHDSTVNKMGQAGLSPFLSDAAYVANHNDLAVCVFYSLRAALQDGTAANLATALYDKQQYDPLVLWVDIEKWYDTSVNCANVVLFEVKRLLNLRLDADTHPTQFISDFCACLLRLEKNKAGIATDKDTLRALLLVAIQDDEFDTVRDSIVHDPSRDVDTILKDIHERDTSLQINDSGNSDGSSFRTARHTSHPQARRQGAATKVGTAMWSIPQFPESWKASFGSKMFQLLLDWRSTVMYKKATQSTLDESFATVTEVVQLNSTQGKCKSCHGGTKSIVSSNDNARVEPSQQATSPSTAETDEKSDERSCKRIRLQKSHRVMTERTG